MREDVATALGLCHGEQRQPAHPIDELGVFIAIKHVEAGRRSEPAVERPGEAIHLPRIEKHVEEHVLVISHENVDVRKRPHAANHIDGRGPAIDHVAKDVDLVVIARGRKIEHLFEGTDMSVNVRHHINRHGVSSVHRTRAMRARACIVPAPPPVPHGIAHARLGSPAGLRRRCPGLAPAPSPPVLLGMLEISSVSLGLTERRSRCAVGHMVELRDSDIA